MYCIYFHSLRRFFFFFKRGFLRDADALLEFLPATEESMLSPDSLSDSSAELSSGSTVQLAAPIITTGNRFLWICQRGEGYHDLIGRDMSRPYQCTPLRIVLIFTTRPPDGVVEDFELGLTRTNYVL